MNAGRSFYRSTNRISAIRFPLIIVGLGISAFLVSVLLLVLFDIGWYLVILLPFITGFILAGATVGLVALAHCRNRWAAFGLGAMTGAGSFLGFFYLSFIVMTQTIPPPSALPAFIVFRMNSDVVHDVGRNDPDKQQKPSSFMNWFAFALEGLAMTFIPASAGWKRASQAYCEERRQWMRKEAILLSPGCGVLIDNALNDGTLDKLIANLPRSGDPKLMANLTIEYATPNNGQSPIDYPIFLSITDPANRLTISQRLGGTNAWSQFRLQPDEIVDILPLFPKLKDLLTSRYQEIQQLVQEKASEVAESAIKVISPLALASVTPVDERYRSKLHNASYKWIINAIGILPLVYVACGVGGVTLGLRFFAWFEKGVPILHSISGALAIVCGIGGIVWGIYIGLYGLSVPENRWRNRRLRALIETKPGGQEWADDCEAVLVSIIPRENFTRVQLTMSSDTLLLRLDRVKGEIKMLGDIDNYTVPAASIVEHAPELFFHPIDAQHQNELWMVRMKIAFQTGPREILLCLPHITFSPSTNGSRKRTVSTFCDLVTEMRLGAMAAVSL